jgi:chromosome segregation ATPase
MNRDYDSMGTMPHLEMWSSSKNACKELENKMDAMFRRMENKMDTMFHRMEKEIKDNYEINREETLGLRHTMNTQNKKLGDTVYRLDNMLKFVDSVEERVIKNTQTTEKLSDTVDNTMQNLRELSESLAATETDLREHAESDEIRSRMLQNSTAHINKLQTMLERMGRNADEERKSMSFVLEEIEKIKDKLNMPRTPPETPSYGHSPMNSDGEEDEPEQDPHRFVFHDEEGNGEPSFEYSDSDQEETRRRDSSSPEYRDANPYPDDSGSDDNWDEGSHVVRQGPDGSFNFAQQ